jgi:desulfoferrodoxin (superoxide reductase-like protein)
MELLELTKMGDGRRNHTQVVEPHENEEFVCIHFVMGTRKHGMKVKLLRWINLYNTMA